MSLLTELAKRQQQCRYGFGRTYPCRSNWNWWGRWAFAGIAVVAFILVLLSCCLIARRRRRRGTKPVYGTGWMAPPPKYGAHENDYQLNSNTQGVTTAGAGAGNAPPTYAQAAPHQQQYVDTTFNSNDGYYGNQSIQSPPNTYQRDNYGYSHQK